MTDRYTDRQIRKSAEKRKEYIPDSFLSKLTETLDSLPEKTNEESSFSEQTAVITHTSSNSTIKMTMSAAAAIALFAGCAVVYTRLASHNGRQTGSPVPGTSVTSYPASESDVSSVSDSSAYETETSPVSSSVSDSPVSTQVPDFSGTPVTENIISETAEINTQQYKTIETETASDPDNTSISTEAPESHSEPVPESPVPELPDKTPPQTKEEPVPERPAPETEDPALPGKKTDHGNTPQKPEKNPDHPVPEHPAPGNPPKENQKPQ